MNNKSNSTQMSPLNTPWSIPGQNPPNIKSNQKQATLLTDRMGDSLNKFFRRAKLLFATTPAQDGKFLEVQLRFPIEVLVITVLVVVVNIYFVGSYYVEKSADAKVQAKITTKWTDVSGMKAKLNDLAKVQKTIAPATVGYEKAIKAIIDSGVEYSQIKPSDMILSVDIKAAPEDITKLFEEFKKENVSFQRTSLSFQTSTENDGTISNTVSSTITITPSIN